MSTQSPPLSTRVICRTVTADSKSDAEKQVIEAISGYADNLQVSTVTPVKTFEVSVLAWDNPVHDKVGNPISKGDKVLFGAAENVRVGIVDYVGKRHLNIVAEDTGWPNERRPNSVIVLPANLDTVPTTIEKLVIATA